MQKKDERLNDILYIKGGMVIKYPLKKGKCYLNDRHGNVVYSKCGNPIIRDKIDVFVIVDHIEPGDDGNPKTVYVDGFSLDQVGQRLENKFYRYSTLEYNFPSKQINSKIFAESKTEKEESWDFYPKYPEEVVQDMSPEDIIMSALENGMGENFGF